MNFFDLCLHIGQRGSLLLLEGLQSTLALLWAVMKSWKQLRWTTWPQGTIVPMVLNDEHSSSRQMTQFSDMVIELMMLK
jgi:hypothetical protein